MKILVTPRSITKDGHPALDMLTQAGFEIVFSTPGRQPDEDELVRLLPGCVGYLAGVEKITERVLNSATDLKVISRNGVGIDNIDLECARGSGIRICRAEGANARGVAELVIGLILALTRSIPFSDAVIKKGVWERRMGIELNGRTLGLIGCGRIGKQVARLALGVGLDVIAFDPFADYSFAPSDRFRFHALQDVLKRSDIISLHSPPPEDGRPIIDGEAVALIKHGAYLINTARAGLLDQEAVLNALRSGKLAGVAVDVFAKEPPVDDELAMHPRVVATPHIGGYTEESISRCVQAAVENLLDCLQKGSDA